jgi:hypothetical protein
MDWDSCLRRAPELEISAAPDGLLVYQRDRDRVHFLNPTAALVLESCDGTLRAGDLPDLVAAAFALDASPVDDVAACLASLLQEGLLVGADLHAMD